ncbi:Stk1 family PASTA domain-containing Ser/Thr kinase [Aeromicrobium sp. IC_218]|uniref:Stk1 family PASTA domain-containing Ser/Thr kinase n=1 Tax=Aeromicrobium sp. IC_218 TaxID=2545468 RepID=UPI0010388E78|nr:Stk1 family PASTA domain-containing Ser/Thr kinase [Aeromicrobium sp. IC_218]TCI99745.1 Stk1 family PASTA domain-containing Ser/Thr kinase [Aeromicrobium sp. IC_218]
MAARGDEALRGRVLEGRYVIGERIARGGMASVFLGHDRRLDRQVAVKVMHQGLGDDEQFTERFVREARSAAKLNHPNVVAVFDQGTDEELTYLVMEYVPGHTLRDVVRDEAPMRPARALRLLEQVLLALSAAHAAHLVHRDIKPENVLIAPDGVLKVADFGLARAVSAATTATGGTLIGTVSYLAPEIVVNAGTDARSDVYACGAMLFEMLTGVKPHTGESPIQVAYRHVHEDVPAPSSVVPGIPPYLDALVARATARDRDRRSPDAHVLLQQVRTVLRALDAGLADDPDLTADLDPGSSEAWESEVTQRVADVRPASVLGLAPEDVGSSTVVVAPDAEHTMSWQSAPAEPAPPAPDLPPARRRRRRGGLLLLCVLLLAVLAAAGGWYYGVGRYTEAPDLVGVSFEQARQTAEQEGFTLETGQPEYSETVPKGTVISTDPEPGDKVLPGDTLQAVVSLGKERYQAPNLAGRTLDEAKAALEGGNLALGDVRQVYDDDVANGRVVRLTSIKPGTLLKRDTPVDLTVSKGKQPVEVNSQVGRKRDAAVSALEKSGLKPTVTEAFSDTVPEGVVIDQNPREGTLFRGDEVKLVVSKGPEMLPVPDVRGRSRAEAEQALTAAGFKPQVRDVLPGNDSVIVQSPSGGKLKRGSTVTIYC